MAFKQAMVNATLNTKGDPAFVSSGSSLMDIFTLTRDKDVLTEQLKKRLLYLLPLAWKESPLKTTKMIFYKRNCRSGEPGAGERDIFYLMYTWLSSNHTEVAQKNLHLVPRFGYFKDLLNLYGKSVLDDEIIKFYAKCLLEDKKKLEADGKNMSLAAMWAPSIKGAHDKTHNSARKIALQMGCFNKKTLMKDYRVFLSRARSALQVTERRMCLNEWEDIDYSKVPSISMNRNKKAFKNHDEDRFTEWESDVKEGKAEVKSSQLLPHQLVDKYFNNFPFDQTTENQWRAFSEKYSDKFSNSIVIGDLSYSMNGTPMLVSIAMSVLISENTQGEFRNLMITFSDKPTFAEVNGDTLYEKVNCIKEVSSIGLNTNFLATHELILARCKRANVEQKDMIKRIYCVTDMEFDEADRSGSYSNFEVISKLYKDAGYTIPELVFINVDSAGFTVPVTQKEKRTCIVAGNSPAVLLPLFSGEDLQNGEAVMNQSLDHECFNPIQI
jgi:hypothetical protein